MTHRLRSPLSLATRLVCTAFLCALLVGCASGRLRTFYDETGKPEPFKRRAYHSSVDYIHRFTPHAYDHWGSFSAVGLSADQKTALVDHGTPDYARDPFRSQFAERTEEWVYLDESLLLQFVGGVKVYEGPVTKLEQILIERGYPRFASITDGVDEPCMTTFIYKHWIGGRIQIYTFADGQLLSKVE